MESDRLEERLLGSLTRSHFRGVGTAALQVAESALPSLSDVFAVGLDTNILKRLAHDGIFANNLPEVLKASSVRLIIPGQCVIEFWNNYKRFAAEDAQKLQREVQRLDGVLKQMGALSLAAGQLDRMEQLVEEIIQEVRDAASAEYLERSRLILELVLRDAIQPMASRAVFGNIAVARQGCKVPPGFADEARKGVASLGDFFVWCDFLLGALSLEEEADGRKFLFITDDSKPDWKTGNSGHPEFLHEFSRVTDNQLVVSDLPFLRTLISRRGQRDATGTTPDATEL